MLSNKEELKKERGERAFKLYEGIKENERIRRKLFIKNICDLVLMHDEKLYAEILGEDKRDANWSGFLADLEIYYTRSKIERWRKIIAKFVGQFKMDPIKLTEIPETRLGDIVGMAETKEEAEELFSQAKTFIPNDWRNVVRKKQGKKTTEDCNHDKLRVYRICEDCGFKIKENIKWDEPINKDIQEGIPKNKATDNSEG